jgi:hypothetical protein
MSKWTHSESTELIAANCCDDDYNLRLTLNAQGGQPYSVCLTGKVSDLATLGSMLGEEVTITVTVETEDSDDPA